MNRILRAIAITLGISAASFSVQAVLADDNQASTPVSLGASGKSGTQVKLVSPTLFGGQGKSITAKPAKLNNGPVKLTNGPVKLTNGPVQLGGGPVQLGGGPVQLGGGPVQLSNGPVKLTNGPVKLTNGTVKLTNGTVNLGGGITLSKVGPCNHHLIVGTDTLFAFDKSDLTPTAEKTMAHLGELIHKYGKHPLTVEGHTDGLGTDQYNQGLSERRANAVKTWLVARNFVTEQTPATGYGKRRPVAPNQKPDGSDNPAGRQLNRRVEVVIDTCH